MYNKPILETIDADVVERLVSRREAIMQGARASSAVVAGLALGSVPVALAALSRDVFGQAPAQVKAALDFAFALENFEAELYKSVLGQSSASAYNTAFAPVRTKIQALPNATAVLATFTLIKDHEVAHVNFLKSVLDTMGGPARTWTATDFDFTGGDGSQTGPFAPATEDVGFLLATAQGIEDTGVRAYKGQAGEVMSNDTVLEAALRIHSVEARHAAKIRKMRREAGATAVVRFSGTIRGGGAAAAGAPSGLSQAVVDAFAAIYANEQNTTQGSINLTTLSGLPGGTDALTEAFDEPLTRAQVVAIVDPFLIPALS